jgi:hypothetical protein
MLMLKCVIEGFFTLKMARASGGVVHAPGTTSMAQPSPVQEGWYAVDNTFGPAATDCRGNFDFTLLFEESVLSILPSALFLLIVPYRFLHIYRGSRKVRRSVLQTVKLVSSPSVHWR